MRLYTLKQKFTLALLVLISTGTPCISLRAAYSEEKLKKELNHLPCHSPYVYHIDRFRDLFMNFLNKDNKESYESHILKMRQALKDFHNVVLSQCVYQKDTYKKIYPLASTLYNQLNELVEILESYTENRPGAMELGFRLERFKHLLPQEAQAKGVFALLGSLSSRLSC